MHIDLRTVSIEPLRQTFDHIAARIGPDKAASRYLEGTMDLQAGANPHYRPTWDPDHEIFDARRTAITMKDWYALKDPRQFYYGTYTASRAKMQETAEADFEFVESRGLDASYDDGRRALVRPICLCQGPPMLRDQACSFPVEYRRTSYIPGGNRECRCRTACMSCRNHARRVLQQSPKARVA